MLSSDVVSFYFSVLTGFRTFLFLLFSGGVPDQGRLAELGIVEMVSVCFTVLVFLSCTEDNVNRDPIRIMITGRMVSLYGSLYRHSLVECGPAHILHTEKAINYLTQYFSC